MLDPIRTFARHPGRRYFVRGSVVPRGEGRSETDFGAGIYAWPDDADSLDRAAVWAGRTAQTSLASCTPSVSLLEVTSESWDELNWLALRTTDRFDVDRWRQVVSWYRQRDAGPGPADDHDVVSGPMAAGRRPRYVPKTEWPDQFRFLPRIGRHLVPVGEVADGRLGR